MMTNTIKKGVALFVLGLLLVGSVGAAAAQGAYSGAPIMHHGPIMMHPHPHMAIRKAQAHYARAIARGNYRAAERAHMRAMMIRRHMRMRREMRMRHGAY